MVRYEPGTNGNRTLVQERQILNNLTSSLRQCADRQSDAPGDRDVVARHQQGTADSRQPLPDREAVFQMGA